MKKIFLLIIVLGIFACGENSDSKNNSFKKEIKIESITSEMGCENCGMSLKKFISTSHAVKMKNGDSHFYCSINCSTDVWETLKDNAEIVFAMDYGQTKYISVEEMHYVIGSNLQGTMTKISKFAFVSLDKAESFKLTFSGSKVVDYIDAFKMSKEEIISRKKKH